MPDSRFSSTAFHEPSSTDSSLLHRIQSEDPDAWSNLVRIYGPLIYRWCRRCDLQPSDASDVAQEVFRSVAAKVTEFRRDRPSDSFRGWLWTITRNKVRDHLRSQKNRPHVPGGSEMQRRLVEMPEISEEESFPDSGRSDKHRLLHAALDVIKPEFESATWVAFWQMIVDGRTAAEVADELEISPAAVRQAKYRVLRRLRREMDGLL